MTSFMKTTFGTPFWKDKNISAKGSIVSGVAGVAGAAVGLTAYKITKEGKESFAKGILATKEEDFLKKRFAEFVKIVNFDVEKGSIRKEAGAKMVEKPSEDWLDGAKKLFSSITEDSKKTVSACKKAKIKYVAFATLVGIGLYKIVKDIKNRDKTEPEINTDVKSAPKAENTK